MAKGVREFTIISDITEPMTGSVQNELAVLGDKILQVLYYKNANRFSSVYYRTGGGFSLELIKQVALGAIPGVFTIDDIPVETAVYINVNTSVNFMRQDLTNGLNPMVWRPYFIKANK